MSQPGPTKVGSHATRAISSVAWAVVLGLASSFLMGGCYQRVVSASGPGTEGYTIHDPASEGVMFKRFDRWIMGEPEPVKHKR